MKKNIIFLCVLCITQYIFTDNTTTLHRYLWANYNHFSGNKTQANDWYKKLFSSTNSLYTYKGYLHFLADTQQFKQITLLIPSLNKKFEKDPEIQLIFADALEKTNQRQEADNHIIMLSQLFKTHSEITFRATQIYMRRKEPENALLTINGFLNSTPRRANNFVFYFLKTQIYLNFGKFTDALNSIQTCLELHPQFDKGWLLCASLCEKEGKIKEALTGYAHFLELSGGNATIEHHLASLMFKYKTMQESTNIVLTNKISIENALTLFKQKRYNQALEHINSCLQQTPISTDCKLLKLQILSAMNDFQQAANSITEWMTQEPDTDIWAQSLYLLSHNGMPRTQAIETFSTLIKQIPHNPWVNLYCADLCMRESQTEHAITYLTNALTCTMENSLRIQTLYQLALLHYEHNNHQAMLTNLETAYALNQDSAHINNALAYYWATKGKDLEKAHPFITKALAIDNTNPYFLDTQALILYKEKKYEAAQQILEKLVLHNNGTMLLHLAKVHYALNNKENADTFTKKAHAVVKNCHEKKALNKMELLLAS